MKKLRNVGFKELLLGKGNLDRFAAQEQRLSISNSHIILFIFSHL
jgi:hypothetical protein